MIELLKELKPVGFEQALELLGVIVAFLSVMSGIVVWFLNQRSANIARKVDASKPFLELQLKLYQEAIGLSSKIANKDGDTEEHTKKLYNLYFGKLALVESIGVERAMVALKDAIEKNETELIKNCSLKLAHECRKSLDKSWGIRAWARNRWSL